MSADRERYERAMQLFQQAAEMPPDERDSFLDRACDGDRGLADHVRELLAADASPFDLGRIRLPTEPESPGGEAIPAGVRIGPYGVVAELGRGGWGAVYLAERADDAYRQRVAIKVVHGGWLAAERLRRFQAERQILAELKHSNIARLMDAGETENRLPYVVMEYVDGLPVDEYCDREHLSVRWRLKLFLEICGAVQYAHQRLVVHRDLKPANIVVTAAGEPKLLDFGIAKILDPASFPIDVEHTAEAHRLLTPDYASPEQIRGDAITTATDVYSLGVVLFLLLTGRLPFALHGESLTEIERTICETPPPQPSLTISSGAAADADAEELAGRRATAPAGLRRQLRGDLDNIVLKALAKEPAQRYQSVEQLAGDVENVLHGRPVSARPASLGYQLRKFVGRHRGAVAGAVVALAILVAFAVTMTVQARRIASERDRANREAATAGQVQDFLVGLFELADPGETRGSSITAREVLDTGAARIRRELADQPQMQATLMETMGRVYRLLGLYSSAESLLEDSLAIRRTALGGRHPEVAASLFQRAELALDLGDYEAALDLSRRSLELLQALLDSDDPAVIASLSQRATVHFQRGDLETAATGFRRGLELLGPEETGLRAELSNDLGVVLQVSGDLESAGGWLEESLELRRKHFGEVHPETLESLNNFALFRHEAGELDVAESLFVQLIERYRTIYGETYPRIPPTLNNLALVRQDMGELETAEATFREAIALQRTALATDHPNLGVFLNNHADVLEVQGRLEEADRTYGEALAVLRGTLGEDHWLVGLASSKRSGVLAELGRYDEAESLALTGHSLLVAGLGPDHQHTQFAAERVADLYERSNRGEDLESWRRRAMSGEDSSAGGAVE